MDVKMTDLPIILGSRSHVRVHVGDPPLLHSKTGSRITPADYAVEAGFEFLILLSLCLPTAKRADIYYHTQPLAALKCTLYYQ